VEAALVLLVSLLCAVVCHVMAQRRGRNALLWALLGFLVGPIPALLLLLIGSQK
jgi:hypothetical protein